MTIVDATHPPTVVLRHRKERLSKCSLRGLERREDFRFYTYPEDTVPQLPEYVTLGLEGPELGRGDAGRGLFLIDGTWRYAERMARNTPAAAAMLPRTLPPGLRTAYPRRQEDCPDPTRGLASVEALYAAFVRLGWPTEGLLANYVWADAFLALNAALFEAWRTA